MLGAQVEGRAPDEPPQGRAQVEGRAPDEPAQGRARLEGRAPDELPPGPAGVAGPAPDAPPPTPAALAPGPCPRYHDAVELIGRRWTGVIVATLLCDDAEPRRFGELAAAVPELSDRMLSERLRELEERGLVVRDVVPGPPVKVTYALTEMGRGLAPALGELKQWARRWLPPPAHPPTTTSPTTTALTSPALRPPHGP